MEQKVKAALLTAAALGGDLPSRTSSLRETPEQMLARAKSQDLTKVKEQVGKWPKLSEAKKQRSTFRRNKARRGY